MKHKHLSIEEREHIQLGLWQKESIRSIARRLERSPSSILREVRKNLPPEKRRYTPRLAEARAQTKRHEEQGRVRNAALRKAVVAGLKRGWSPEQIAGESGDISHETIYAFVYDEWRRGGEDLRPLLKRRHKARQRKGFRKYQRLQNPHKPSIEQRPKVVGRRARLGDWEGDLIVSRASRAALVTLLERKSGYVAIEKVSGKTARATARAMIRRLRGQAKTLTLDNGSEHNHWKYIEDATGARVFFAHPYSSFERGANENTNGLIRWYLPKGTDFETVSKRRIKEIERALNGRPRKRLGYRTPLEVFGSVAISP